MFPQYVKKKKYTLKQKKVTNYLPFLQVINHNSYYKMVN